jgi:mannose-6-phosphate isomerase-like protein (cupin superfamily)
MHVTLAANAPAYSAPGHDGVRMWRLQGMDVSPLQGVWSARLDVAPGAHMTPKSSPAAKLYIVASGAIRLRGGEQTVELAAGDTAFVLPHEEREIWGHTQQPACVYLVMLERYSADLAFDR